MAHIMAAAVTQASFSQMHKATQMHAGPNCSDNLLCHAFRLDLLLLVCLLGAAGEGNKLASFSSSA